MKVYFSAPMVILFALCALVMFYDHSDAGYPVVYSRADATSSHAKATVDCGIKGNLTNGESYSGSAYCYARVTTESDTVRKARKTSIWAEVYRTGVWPFRRLKVRTSATVSAVVLGDDATSSYAYARGTLGDVYDRVYMSYTAE